MLTNQRRVGRFARFHTTNVARPRVRAVHAGLAALLLVASFPGHSQTKTEQNAATTALRSEATLFEALGLWLRLPESSLIETSAVGSARQSVVVRPQDSSWRLAIEERVSRDTRLSPLAVAAEMLKELREARVAVEQGDRGKTNVGSKVLLLSEPHDAAIGGRPAARFAAQTSQTDSTPIVTAYAIAAREPGRVVVFSLACLPPEFERAGAMFDATLEAARFKDAGDVGAERAAAIAAGQDFVSRLTAADLDNALPAEARWLRIYKPAPTGAPADATEIAYQKIEIRKGSRADLDKRKGADQASGSPEGFIVRSVARYIEGDRVVDSDSSFFATLLPGAGEDDEETWTIRMGIKEKKDQSIWTETGARRGNRLSVRVAPPEAPATEKQWLTPDKAYIPQVLTHMLPRLLARSHTPMTYGFYAYNSAAGDLALRRDTVEPGPSGGWVVRTRLGEGLAERVSTYDDNGELIRTEMGDGTVVEPIDVERLQALWKSKGLPTN